MLTPPPAPTQKQRGSNMRTICKHHGYSTVVNEELEHDQRCSVPAEARTGRTSLTIHGGLSLLADGNQLGLPDHASMMAGTLQKVQALQMSTSFPRGKRHTCGTVMPLWPRLLPHTCARVQVCFWLQRPVFIRKTTGFRSTPEHDNIARS